MVQQNSSTPPHICTYTRTQTTKTHNKHLLSVGWLATSRPSAACSWSRPSAHTTTAAGAAAHAATAAVIVVVVVIVVAIVVVGGGGGGGDRVGGGCGLVCVCGCG